MGGRNDLCEERRGGYLRDKGEECGCAVCQAEGVGAATNWSIVQAASTEVCYYRLIMQSGATGVRPGSCYLVVAAVFLMLAGVRVGVQRWASGCGVVDHRWITLVVVEIRPGAVSFVMLL